MKIPVQWLGEFVDLKTISNQTLQDTISLKAFEVESLESRNPEIKPPLLSGKILDVAKHPNADKLQIATVQVNNNEDPKQIVCGASNIEIGQVVPVALPGSSVINRQDNTPLLIKSGKIRGIVSEGMLCSAQEIGIQDSNDQGIYILDNQLDLGIDLIHHLKLTPEYIIDIESRSNRQDTLCVQGIAREVACAFNTKLLKDYYNENHKDKLEAKINNLAPIRLQIENYDKCKGAIFFHIENIHIQDSPQWMKNYLEHSNIKSINNIVDILNYVMLEIGQPMHAYDADKFNWKEGISIRQSTQEESHFDGLDEKSYRLSPDKSLAICDNKQIGCLAGVMGGQSTCISDSTTNIILEIACFNSATVRHSSRYSGVSSESSRRFERGTNLELLEIAGLRTVELIESLANGRLAAYTKDVSPELQNPPITLSLLEYQRKIGIPISKEQTIQILTSLDCLCKEISEDKIEVTVPIFRQKDLLRPIDIYEELVRFQGLNNVPSMPLPPLQTIKQSKDLLFKLKTRLVQFGFTEIWSSSLASKEIIDLHSIYPNKKPIGMKNPLSLDYSFLRTSLLPSLLKATALNAARQEPSISLFEIGKVYYQQDNLNDDIKDSNSQEIEYLGIISSTHHQHKDISWNGNHMPNPDYYSLKGIVEQLLNKKGKLEFNKMSEEESGNLFHPGISASITLNKKSIGYIAKLHPNTIDEWKVHNDTYIILLPVEVLLTEPKFKFKELNNNQVIEKDFTIDVPTELDIKYSDIHSILDKQKNPLLFNHKLLTTFSRDNTFAMSFRLYFQQEAHISKQLTNEEINPITFGLVKAIQEKFPTITFRE